MTIILRPDLQAVANLIQPNEKVLDLGCGRGVLLGALADKGFDPDFGARPLACGIERHLQRIDAGRPPRRLLRRVAAGVATRLERGFRAGQLGLKVALVDDNPKGIGGTCLHIGCIPTKAMLASADLLDHMKHSSEFGISASDVTADPDVIAAPLDPLRLVTVEALADLPRNLLAVDLELGEDDVLPGGHLALHVAQSDSLRKSPRRRER